MRADAEDYLAASQALARVHANPGSFAAALLALVGLELLVKLVFELATNAQAPKHHRLAELVAGLPDSTRDALTLDVVRRASGHIEGTFDDALKDWGESMVTMRYPYDLDRGMSDEARERRDAAWVEHDAPIEQAQFRFHPILFAATIDTLLRWTAPVADRDYRLDTRVEPHGGP